MASCGFHNELFVTGQLEGIWGRSESTRAVLGVPQRAFRENCRQTTRHVPQQSRHGIPPGRIQRTGGEGDAFSRADRKRIKRRVVNDTVASVQVVRFCSVCVVFFHCAIQKSILFTVLVCLAVALFSLYTIKNAGSLILVLFKDHVLTTLVCGMGSSVVGGQTDASRVILPTA